MPPCPALVREGLPARGMPAVALADPELAHLVAYLRTLRAAEASALPRVRATLVDGGPF